MKLLSWSSAGTTDTLEGCRLLILTSYLRRLDKLYIFCFNMNRKQSNYGGSHDQTCHCRCVCRRLHRCNFGIGSPISSSNTLPAVAITCSQVKGRQQHARFHPKKSERPFPVPRRRAAADRHCRQCWVRTFSQEW